MTTFFVVYLGFGVIYSGVCLWMLRDIPASFAILVRDAINCALFYPYILQLQWASFKRTSAQAEQFAKLSAEYKANPEKFQQQTFETLDTLKKMLKETAEKEKTGTNDEWN